MLEVLLEQFKKLQSEFWLRNTLFCVCVFGIRHFEIWFKPIR